MPVTLLEDLILNQGIKADRLTYLNHLFFSETLPKELHYTYFGYKTRVYGYLGITKYPVLISTSLKNLEEMKTKLLEKMEAQPNRSFLNSNIILFPTIPEIQDDYGLPHPYFSQFSERLKTPIWTPGCDNSKLLEDRERAIEESWQLFFEKVKTRKVILGGEEACIQIKDGQVTWEREACVKYLHDRLSEKYQVELALDLCFPIAFS